MHIVNVVHLASIILLEYAGVTSFLIRPKRQPPLPAAPFTGDNWFRTPAGPGPEVQNPLDSEGQNTNPSSRFTTSVPGSENNNIQEQEPRLVVNENRKQFLETAPTGMMVLRNPLEDNDVDRTKSDERQPMGNLLRSTVENRSNGATVLKKSATADTAAAPADASQSKSASPSAQPITSKNATASSNNNSSFDPLSMWNMVNVGRGVNFSFDKKNLFAKVTIGDHVNVLGQDVFTNGLEVGGGKTGWVHANRWNVMNGLQTPSGGNLGALNNLFPQVGGRRR